MLQYVSNKTTVAYWPTALTSHWCCHYHIIMIS